MRIYGRGIRRRLASMLNGDQRRLELAYSLMFTPPGTPALLYGEEIGMGDDLAVPGRGSVRTVMQWTPEPNAGFSSPATDPGSFHAPLIAGGPLGYQRVNVADQRRDVHSLFNVMQRIIRTRKETPEFGFGSWRLLATDQPAVLAHEAYWQGGRVLAVHGEVRLDPGSRGAYATDGSNYRQVPIGVVIPHDANDVVAAVATCREHGAPVLGRGGGTSLAGQGCNVAVVLDFTKYMRHLLDLDPATRRARV